MSRGYSFVHFIDSHSKSYYGSCSIPSRNELLLLTFSKSSCDSVFYSPQSCRPLSRQFYFFFGLQCAIVCGDITGGVVIDNHRIQRLPGTIELKSYTITAWQLETARKYAISWTLLLICSKLSEYLEKSSYPSATGFFEPHTHNFPFFCVVLPVSIATTCVSERLHGCERSLKTCRTQLLR